MYDNAITALEKLAAELGSRGFTARLATPPGMPPRLVVSNPAAPMLSETVMTEAGCFWWPWAERIAEEGGISTAADTVARVLRGAEDGQ